VPVIFISGESTVQQSIAAMKPRWPPKLPHLWPRQTPPPELIGDRG
jgi:hypothetical protein